MTKIIIYFLQSLLVYSFFLIGRILGINISRKIFSNLFILIGPLFRSQKILDKNLNIFSSNISLTDKIKIRDNMWKNYGKTFIEYVFLDYFKKNNAHIIIKGKKNLVQINQDNKPVIFISGHFANFELMSMEITKQNISLATIYRPLNNFFLILFMEFLRRKYVCAYQIIIGVSVVREAIEYLKKKHSIALMIDQRVSEGERALFFNKAALTTTLPAQLSVKYNLDIIPVYIERIEDDKFLIEFQKAIKPKKFSNKMELTQNLNSILEKMIEKNPGQWIWTHNRWK